MTTPEKGVTRQTLEKIPKCKLQWLQTQVQKYVDDEWRARFPALSKNAMTVTMILPVGHLVEYHQKVYGADAIARQFASCGMQRLYAPFRGILAKAMELTDWDIVKCHPALLVQLCGQYSVSCPFLTDYVTRRDSWISLVINTVNKSLAKASSSAEEPADKEKAPLAPIGRKEAKNLFIRMFYLGGTGE